MHVLISIQQPVPQWQIPEAAARAIVARFPDVRFIYATTEDERARGLETADAAYTWILNATELARAPRLQWVHTSAVAVETFCLPEMFARGIRVSNTRGVQAVPIAEHVMAVLFALAKQIPFMLENQRQARWAQNDFVGDRLPWLLRGRTLGLIGVGTIGAAMASRAAALGMRVMALRRQAAADDVPGVTRVYARDELPAMLGAVRRGGDRRAADARHRGLDGTRSHRQHEAWRRADQRRSGPHSRHRRARRRARMPDISPAPRSTSSPRNRCRSITRCGRART